MSKKYVRPRKKSSYVSKGTGSKIINTGKGSIAKKRISKRILKQNLEKEVRKLVREANSRLNSLERRYKSGTWASKRLKNKLGTSLFRVFKGKRIKMRKGLSNTQLLGIHKAISSFLSSKTSTKKGIKSVRKQQIEKIKERLSVDDEMAEEMTDEEAEFFYDMFEDNDFNTLADIIGASALQACIDDAIENDDSEDDFIKRLEWYGGVSMQDLDLREKAIRIYNKYVLGR